MWKEKEANVLLISHRHLANVEQLVGKYLGLYCQLLEVKIKNGRKIKFIKAVKHSIYKLFQEIPQNNILAVIRGSIILDSLKFILNSSIDIKNEIFKKWRIKNKTKNFFGGDL